MFIIQFFRKSLSTLLALGIITSIQADVYGAKKKKKDEKKPPVINEATLQSHVMSFADRFVAIMTATFSKYEAQKPSKENLYIILSTLTYSMSNAYIIAAETDPDVALLDMLCMVTLGRMIFEEDGTRLYGKTVLNVTNGFRRAEADIRKIASKVLTEKQLSNLMAIIKRWRANHPGVTFFPFIRFSNFAADRRESKLIRAEDPGGIFDSVEAATEQAEEIRLLAERAMYLASRLPQLSGAFSKIWLAGLMDNSDIQKVMADLSTLASSVEKFPDHIARERKESLRQAMQGIAKERKDAIKQFVNAMAAERKAIVDDFLTEEQRVSGLLTDLRQTIDSGNQLITSMNLLTAQLDFGSSTEYASSFDIKDYQAAFKELSNSAHALSELAVILERINASVDKDRLISQIAETLDKMENEGEELVDHTIQQFMILIGIWMVGYIIARVLILHISKKMNISSR